MTRPRRARDRADELTDTEWNFINDGPLDQADQMELLALRADQPNGKTGRTLKAIWRDHADDVIEAWIETRPGTRPSCWWRFDAREPRRRLGGTGTPAHERLAYVRRLARGVPVDWIMPADVETYAAIGQPLDVPAVDPADPPTFESEATYLRRLGLLLPGEAKRIRKAAWSPERIEADGG